MSNERNREVALAAHTITEENTKCRIVIEYTVNVSPKHWPKDYSLIQKMERLKMISEEIVKEYQTVRGSYRIEYCKSGEPHLHGFLEVELPPQFFAVLDCEILRMFAKTIFMQLPRPCYKQFATASIHSYLRRFTSAAVVLNLKNCLEQGWVDYINKSAFKA